MEIQVQKTYFIEAFLNEAGFSGTNFTISPLAGDGSKRLFQRLELKEENQSFIFMENKPQDDFLKKENNAYLMIGNHLRKKEIPLPEILRHDPKNGFFIIEDMGDISLQEKVLNNKNRIKIYENVLETLLKLQWDGKDGFDTNWCCQTPFYDSRLMREFEAYYFRDAFLINYAKVDTDYTELNNAFEHIISIAEKAECKYLLHRDFQSRNIMIRDDGIAILDWQGARIGPLAYDVASLVYDPYVDLTPDERRHLIKVYTSLIKIKNSVAFESFNKYFSYIAAMRILQALGAYAFLSKKQGKTYFKKYIPIALKALKSLLDEISDIKLSPLMDTIKGLEK